MKTKLYILIAVIIFNLIIGNAAGAVISFDKSIDVPDRYIQNVTIGESTLSFWINDTGNYKIGDAVGITVSDGVDRMKFELWTIGQLTVWFWNLDRSSVYATIPADRFNSSCPYSDFCGDSGSPVGIGTYGLVVKNKDIEPYKYFIAKPVIVSDYDIIVTPNSTQVIAGNTIKVTVQVSKYGIPISAGTNNVKVTLFQDLTNTSFEGTAVNTITTGTYEKNIQIPTGKLGEYKLFAAITTNRFIYRDYPEIIGAASYSGIITINASAPAPSPTPTPEPTATPTPEPTVKEPFLVFAITPNSRVAQVGVPITLYLSIINGGTATANNVTITQFSSLPATVSYQQWNGTMFIGYADTSLDMAAGATANFVLSINATEAFDSSSMTFNVSGTNVGAAPISAVNTLTISANTTPSADVIMISTNLNVSTPVNNGTAFALATMNVGGANATGVSLVLSVPSTITGLAYQVNQTNSTTGAIIGSATGLTIEIAATPTFAVFLTPTKAINFDPTNNRIMFQLVDGSGKVIGAQSVAVSST